MDIISEPVKNKSKTQKDGFLSKLLGTLETSMLENLLTEKRIMTAGKGAEETGTGFIKNHICHSFYFYSIL